MPVEEIIKEYNEQKKIIADAQKKQEQLVDALISANDKEWDLITVWKAAQKADLSPSTIYRFIQQGKIKSYYKGSLMYVSNSELEKLNEK